MTSRNEKTIRQIRQILQTSDDYEKKERNLSQNSPFSCYLTPRANLYNQYPYRIPLSRKSTKKSTKKRRTKNTLDDFTSNPFLFNNSNPLYRQLSNSAKKAFLPYSDTRLNSYSRLNSSSNLKPHPYLQTQSVQTSLALILDQSDTSDDPITAKQNEILSFIGISEKLLLKKVFNRWRQRWFFQTAYTAQKLIQTTGFSTLSHHSRRSIAANDSQSKEKLSKNDLESKKLASNEQSYHKIHKSRHHHSTAQANKNSISQSANKRLIQTEIRYKNDHYDRNDDNTALDTYEDYEYVEYDDTNQNDDKNRQIHRHHRSRRLKTRESNDKDQYSNYEYDYEYEDDIDTGSGNETKRRRKISKNDQNLNSQKMSKTAKTQTDKILLENTKSEHSTDLKSKTYNLNSKRNDEYNDVDDSDFLNDQNLFKPMLQLNDKSGTANKQSYNNNNTNTNTKISQNFFDDSSTSLIDDRNQSLLQKPKNSTQKDYSFSKKDDEKISNRGSLLNSPIKSNNANKINKELLDLSSDSFLDGIDLYKPQTAKSSTQKNSMLIEKNENNRYSRKNSPSKNLTDNFLNKKENDESFRNKSDLRKSSQLKTKENDNLFGDLDDSDSSSLTLNIVSPKMSKQQTTTTNSQKNSSLFKSEENNRNSHYNSTMNNNHNSTMNSQYNSTMNSQYNSTMNNNYNSASNSRRNSPSRSRQNESFNANQNYIDYSNEILNDDQNQFNRQNTTINSTQRNSSLLRSEENNRNSHYNSTITNNNNSTFNNTSNSRRNSPSRRAQNGINQNYIDYTNESISETQNQSRQQRTQNSTQRNQSQINSEDRNRSNSRYNSAITNNTANINTSSNSRRNSPSRNNQNGQIQNYSEFSDDDQNHTLQNRRSIPTQKNLSSAISEENDQYHHNHSRKLNGNRKSTQNNSDYSDDQIIDSRNRSNRHNSPQRKSSIIESTENRHRRRNNSPMNNSSEYQNNSDYSVGYANTEQEVNQRRNFSSNRKTSANQSRTKEFTFAGSKTFSPIKTPKNFDEVASQIIPDLDEFIEKFSKKPPNYSLDDESDIEFKSLIEKSRYFKSKYSHLTLDDLETENNRSSTAFSNLIPVDTSLDPNANPSALNRNYDTTLHELHVFDHEMTEENGSPPLYFNE